MQQAQRSSQPTAAADTAAQSINDRILKWSQDHKENQTGRKLNRIKNFFMPSSSGKKKPEDFFNPQPGGLKATAAQHQREADKNERKSISKRRLLDDVTNSNNNAIGGGINGSSQPPLQPIISAESAMSSPQRLPLAQLNTIPSAVAEDNQRDIQIVELIDEEHRDGDFVPDTQPATTQAANDDKRDEDNNNNDHSMSLRESQPPAPIIPPTSSLANMTREQPMPIMQSSPIVVSKSAGSNNDNTKLKRKSRVDQIRGEFRTVARSNEPHSAKALHPQSPMQSQFNQSLRRRSASSRKTGGDELAADEFDQFADIDDVVLGSSEIFAAPNSTPIEVPPPPHQTTLPRIAETTNEKTHSPPTTRSLQIQVIPIDSTVNSAKSVSLNNKSPAVAAETPAMQPPQSTISITRGRKGAAAAAAAQAKTPSLQTEQRQPSPSIMPPPALPVLLSVQKSASTNSVNTTKRSGRSRLADVTNIIDADIDNEEDDTSILQSQRDLFLKARRSSASNSTVNKTAANQTTSGKASALFTPALPRPPVNASATTSTASTTTATTKTTKRGLTAGTNLNMQTESQPQQQPTPIEQDIPRSSADAAMDDIITIEDEQQVVVPAKKRGRKPKEVAVARVAPAPKEAPKTQEPVAAKRKYTKSAKKTTEAPIVEPIESAEKENHQEEGPHRISLRQRHTNSGKRLVYGWDWETTADGQRIYVKKVVGCERRNDYVDELVRLKATGATKKRQRTTSPKKRQPKQQATTTATVPNVPKTSGGKKKKVIEDEDDEVEEIQNAPPQKKKARSTPATTAAAKATRSDQKTPQMYDDDIEVDHDHHDDVVVEEVVVAEHNVEVQTTMTQEMEQNTQDEDESIGVNIINQPEDVPVVRITDKKSKDRRINLNAFNRANATEKNPALRKIENVLLEKEPGVRVPTQLYFFRDKSSALPFEFCYPGVSISHYNTNGHKYGILRVEAATETKPTMHRNGATYVPQSAHPVVVSIEQVPALVKAGDLFRVPTGANYVIKNLSETDAAYFFFEFV